MEHPAWRAFVRHKTNVFEDLDVKDILDELFSEEVINLNEYELIQSKPSRIERNNCFLSKLPRLPAQKFSSFLTLLEKNYNWLYELISSSKNVELDEETSYQDLLIKGNIPRAPPHYVERKQQLQNLTELLKRVEPRGRIVVHGMTGCGKSCLVAAAVKTMIHLESYENRVFWINLGEVKSNEQLISHMQLLLQRLSFDLNEINGLDGLNQILKTDFLLKQDVGILKNYLSCLFTMSSHRNTLLILDNANSTNTVDAFDVGCKIVVTTQNKQIIHGNSVLFLEVKDGFTEEETLLLFAKCLQTTVDKLPPQASKIHKLCKGQPLIVSLMGSLFEQNKEDLLNSSNRWQYYVKKLTEKDFTLGSSKNDKDVLFRTIKLCIKNLEPKLQKLYELLVVFVEDVNITPKVLQTLWNLDDIYAVEEVMAELQNKSLVVSHYSQELKIYVYGIHALLLAYLRQKYTKDQIKELHRTFVKAYKNTCAGNFANLCDDNYIFQYLGYHLSEAQMYDDFCQIYFDLNFIGAKIKAVGIADLLKDFQLYRKHITCKEEILERKLKDFEQFIKIKGQDLFKYNYTNIVQSALELKSNYVYETALKVAQENTKRLYFQLHAPQENVNFTYTIDVKDVVTAVCFTNDPDQILVGNANGDITLWEHNYGGQLCTFNGHTKRITRLQIRSDGTEFLSVSEDGCTKIWKLEENANFCKSGCSPDDRGRRQSIPSPKVKQSPYTNFFNDDSVIDRSRTFKLSDSINDAIVCASYSTDDNKYVVTGCLSGKVIVWNLKDDKPVLTIPGKDRPVRYVTFSDDDKFIIFCCDNIILFHDTQNGQFISQFCNEHVINSLLVVPEFNNSLFATSNHSIALWTWQMEDIVMLNLAHTIIYSNKDVLLLSAAVTSDGLYLIAGWSDFYIRMWHISTGNIVKEFSNKGKATCLDIYFRDDPNSDITLLTVSNDSTIKQWRIKPVIESSEELKLLPIFDVYWNTGSSLPRVAAATNNNRVRLFNGQNLITETTKFFSITKICFSLCGNKITIGFKNGEVIEMDIKTKKYKTVLMLHDSVSFLKYFEEPGMKMAPSCTNNKDCPGPSSGTLVAAAENGWFSVYRNDKAMCLVQPPSPSDLKQVPIFPIVSCFYIKSAGKLLSITQNRTVKAWNLKDASYTVLIGEKTLRDNEKQHKVVMVSLSDDESLLAITMSDNTFDIYGLQVQNSSYIMSEYKQGGCLESAITCCCFSHDGSFLAFGHDNGSITIWSVELKEVLYSLDAHKREICHLQFSPSPMFILVSVADQIIWWNLMKVPKEMYGGKNRRQKRKSLGVYTNLLSRSKSLYAGPWQDKEGPVEIPHLLSAIKVAGLYASHLSANHNFTAFSTIDYNGYFYIMNLLT